MLADVKNGFNEKAKKSIDSFVEQVKKIRTGRATPSVLDNVMVDYYGTPTPLPQTANVTCPEARLILIYLYKTCFCFLIRYAPTL